MNQRNPRQAPAHAVANTVRLGSPPRNVMAAMTSMAIIDVPPARPSRPSVRLTALESPAMSSQVKSR